MIIDPEALFGSSNEKCKGCSVLSKPGDHSIMDYEYGEEVDVLFVSDSLKMHQGDYVPFRANEYSLISSTLKKYNLPEITKVGFTSSVKCPNINIDLIKASDRKICRAHLIDSILKYKPKLVFPCGKLATTMMFGKSVADTKARGNIIDMEMGGHKFKMVPIIHPFQVIAEPKNKLLFNHDIESAVNLLILGKEVERLFKFELVDSIEQIEKYSEFFRKDHGPKSIDIETTGLNFLEDTIHTVSLSWFENEERTTVKTISFPIYHPEAKVGWQLRSKYMEMIAIPCGDPKTPIVLQECKFDMKFLKKEGVKDFTNVWDTKLMQHLVREDIPKSLIDLVGYYFPGELC